MASYSEYIRHMEDASKKAFCGMLNDPALWSEEVIRRTMGQSCPSTYNILEVQSIIRNYLGILSEAVRKGKRLPVGLLPPSSKNGEGLII